MGAIEIMALEPGPAADPFVDDWTARPARIQILQTVVGVSAAVRTDRDTATRDAILYGIGVYRDPVEALAERDPGR